MDGPDAPADMDNMLNQHDDPAQAAGTNKVRVLWYSSY